MTDNNVLIDTSVWIDYFKDEKGSVSAKVDNLLDTAQIFVPRIVVAELIQGARSEKEISVVEEFIGAFNIIDQQQDTWMKAGRLSFNLKKKGITVNLADCYIALIAYDNSCGIFTLDKHFKDIKKVLKIKLLP